MIHELDIVVKRAICQSVATDTHTELFAAILRRIHRLIQPVPV